MGPTGCPETSVTNYTSTLRNIPAVRRTHRRCTLVTQPCSFRIHPQTSVSPWIFLIFRLHLHPCRTPVKIRPYVCAKLKNRWMGFREILYSGNSTKIREAVLSSIIIKSSCKIREAILSLIIIKHHQWAIYKEMRKRMCARTRAEPAHKSNICQHRNCSQFKLLHRQLTQTHCRHFILKIITLHQPNEPE